LRKERQFPKFVHKVRRKTVLAGMGVEDHPGTVTYRQFKKGSLYIIDGVEYVCS
jgi:hypothetical protein